MTLYLETAQGVFTPWFGQPIDGYQYFREIETQWTTEKREAIGLFVPVTPPVPEGERVVASSVQRVAGVVTFVYVTEDIPAPHPKDRDLTKRQLRLGLYANGYPRTFVQDVIDAIPDAAQKDIATIWWEDSQHIAWDNPMTQTLMGHTALTEADAIAMWISAWGLEA